MIREDTAQSGLFGSFFFIGEVKGCKLLTKEGLGAYADPYQALQAEMPALDFNYMALREHRQLFMDLGITYHAEGEGPLVGLWKLAHAGASYAKGGMNIPVVHNTATLSQY